MKNFALALGIALLGAASGKANLVVNPGFESDAIGSGYIYYASGSNFTGWSVTGPQGSGIDLVRKPEYAGLVNSGNQAIDLSGTPGPGGILQNVGTAANTNYVLSFYLSSNAGPHVGGLQVWWNNVQIATLTSPTSYTLFTYNVASTGAGSNLEFVSTVGGNSGPVLDDVSVVAAATSVPEPTSIAVFGLGGLLLVGLRRRA